MFSVDRLTELDSFFFPDRIIFIRIKITAHARDPVNVMEANEAFDGRRVSRKEVILKNDFLDFNLRNFILQGLLNNPFQMVLPI